MKAYIIFFFSIATLWTNAQITFEKRYYFTEMLYAESVIQENDSGYIIAGNGWSNTNTGYDGCLFRTDKYGDSIWLKPNGFNNANHAYDVIKTNDNGYALTGDGGGDDLLLVKFNNNGNIEWSTFFGGENWEKGYSLFQTVSNNFIVAGYSNSIYGPGPQPYDFYVIKTNSSGNLIWEQKIGGAESEYAYSVCQSINNSCIVAGKTSSYGTGIYLVKLDSNGNTDVYLFNIEEYYVNLLEGENPVSYCWNVECGSILSGQNTPSIVVEWDQEGIGSISVTATNECGTDTQNIYDIFIIYPSVRNYNENHFSIFPNPANDQINFNLQNTKPSFLVKIELRNLYGQLVREEKNIQSSHYAMNVADLKAGVYFYVIKEKDIVMQQGKVIIK